MVLFATLTGHHVQLELAAELGYTTMSKLFIRASFNVS